MKNIPIKEITPGSSIETWEIARDIYEELGEVNLKPELISFTLTQNDSNQLFITNPLEFHYYEGRHLQKLMHFQKMRKLKGIASVLEIYDRLSDSKSLTGDFLLPCREMTASEPLPLAYDVHIFEQAIIIARLKDLEDHCFNLSTNIANVKILEKYVRIIPIATDTAHSQISSLMKIQSHLNVFEDLLTPELNKKNEKLIFKGL